MYRSAKEYYHLSPAPSGHRPAEVERFTPSGDVEVDSPVMVSPPAPQDPQHFSKEKDGVVIRKSTTARYTQLTDPRVWGPSFWLSLHNGALHTR